MAKQTEIAIFRVKTGDLLLPLNLLVIVLIIAIILSPANTVRIILGLPFVLFLPGYALAAALFPRKDALSGIERVALSFGMSIAVASLIGLLLNYMPWGIGVYPIFISLTIFILVMSIIARYQRRRLTEGERLAISFNLSLPIGRGQGTLDKVLTIILVPAILGAMGTIGYAVATPRVGERFTEFYVLGPEGNAIEYPTELKVGEQWIGIVGIVNQEQETASYLVEVTIDGIRNEEIGAIVLEHGEKWERRVTFKPARAKDNQKVEFLLYKNGQSEPYLKPLYLWVNVKE